MECVNCGREYLERQRFCTNCGVDLEVDSFYSASKTLNEILEELQSISFSIHKLMPFVQSGDALGIEVTDKLYSRRESILDKFNDVVVNKNVTNTLERRSYLKRLLRYSGASDLEIDQYFQDELESISQNKRRSLLTEKRGEPALSVNLLSAILLLGVLLLAVSSLILLVTLWSDFSWVMKQGILLLQMAVFITVGHLVKHRQGLHYSGLALVTLGAVWGLFNSGTIAYEFIGARGEKILPGISLAIDLPVEGWLLISSTSFIVWAILTCIYKGHVLAQGCAFLFVATIGLLPSVFEIAWFWGLGSAALSSTLVTYVAGHASRLGMNKSGDYLFWTSQLILPVTAITFLLEWSDHRISLYCATIILMAGALTSLVVMKKNVSKEFEFYRYGFLLSFLLATGIFVFQADVVRDAWFGVCVALMGLSLACSMPLLGRINVQSNVWVNPIWISVLLVSVISSIWPEFTQLAKAVTLLLVGVSVWVSAREISNRNLLMVAGIPLAIGGLLLVDIGAQRWAFDNDELAWFVFGTALLTQLIAFLCSRIFEKKFLPLLSASVLFSLSAVVISGWGDWGNWEGLLMCVIFFCIYMLVVRIYDRKIIAVAALFWLTTAGGFVMGMAGLSLVERSIGWAIESLVLMWLNQAITRISVGRRLFTNTFWNDLISLASLRLSWFALGYVLIALIGGLINSDIFGNADLSILAITLSIVGVSYLGTSITQKSDVLAYGGVVFLISGWIIQAIDWRIGQAQVYAIPVGLYLLGIVYRERMRSSPKKHQEAYFMESTSAESRGVIWSPFIEVMAVLLMGGSAFIQSVTQDPEWIYALLLGIEGVLMVVWGSVSRSKILLIGGVLVFSFNVIYQVTSLLSYLGGAVVGVIVGAVIIILVVIVERFREKISPLIDRFTSY